MLINWEGKSEAFIEQRVDKVRSAKEGENIVDNFVAGAIRRKCRCAY
jgi:hypothetical protein